MKTESGNIFSSRQNPNADFISGIYSVLTASNKKETMTRSVLSQNIYVSEERTKVIKFCGWYDTHLGSQ